MKRLLVVVPLAVAIPVYFQLTRGLHPQERVIVTNATQNEAMATGQVERDVTHSMIMALASGAFLRVGLSSSVTIEEAYELAQRLNGKCLLPVGQPDQSECVVGITVPQSLAMDATDCGRARGPRSSDANFVYSASTSPLYLICWPLVACKKYDQPFELAIQSTVPKEARMLGEYFDLIWKRAAPCNHAAATAASSIQVEKVYVTSKH